LRAASVVNRRHYLPLEYPPSTHNEPRGRNRWLAERISAAEADFYESIRTILRYRDDLSGIKATTGAVGDARWLNGTMPGLDCAALYAFIRDRRPSLYLEIGSGNSTKFAAQAVRDGDLGTSIISIDPLPRTEIDGLCDEVMRSPLETVDLEIFERLRQGDIVFFDGSHRAFVSSDVTVFFLDILPALCDGVLVGIHDIYLPDDYPGDEAVTGRYWNEQYLLATYILGGANRLRLTLPAAYVSRTPELAGELMSLWTRLPHGVEPYGCAFWFEVRSAGALGGL
jgi:hypothetical protein